MIAAVLIAVLGSCVTTKKDVKEFIVDFDAPKIEIGEIEAQFDRFLSLGSLKKVMVPVSYYPTEDAVCLQFRSELVTYYQFWSRDGRDAFISALEKYNADYSARDLDSKNRKSLRQYGTVKGYLVWQLHRFAVRAKANMNVELGYTFERKAPYFTVNELEAEYIDPVSRDNNRTSMIVTMYFTRAQADELAAIFNQDYLDELGMGTSRKITPGINQDAY